MRLSGRIALVTGAGGGIGSAVARCFAAEGAEVVLSDKTERQCRNVEREIVGAGGVARVVAADMMKPHEIAELFSGLEQLDILCTVAGGDCDPVADVTALDEDRIGMNLDLNLRSCMLCCREAARIMKWQDCDNEFTDVARGGRAVQLCGGERGNRVVCPFACDGPGSG